MKKTDTARRKSLVRRILIVSIPSALLYAFIIYAFCRTPNISYWLDDEIYGNTKYFHFKEGDDAWSQSLAIENPQNVQDSYRLAIIELDEFGDFFQSENDASRPRDYQLACATEMLKTAGATKPIFLILFIHGWQHNASRDNQTLIGFKKLLGCIARSEKMASRFSICGVYVGWRGAGIKNLGLFTRPAELLSFWQRKSVAEKIASTTSSMSIFRLIDVAHAAAPDPANNPSSTVLAGHSLGAGILLNSVSQALAYEYASAESDGIDAPKLLDSPANLILLLNPAVESVYLRQLRTSLQPLDWEEERGYPWLVSLTSETDWVTKHIFPLAHTWRFSSNPRKAPYVEKDWKSYASSPDTSPELREVSQAVYAKETPGHNIYMRDVHIAVKRNTESKVEDLKTNYRHYDDPIAFNMHYGARNYFLLGGDNGESWYGYFDKARPEKDIHPLFWVTSVDRMIMHGHGLPFDSNDIRQSNFLATVMAIVFDSRVQHHQVKSRAKFSLRSLTRQEKLPNK